ncbi:MAG: tyrosine-type recombinase/integrase [candidate division Zixibacteria bacterium]|nr:tyrosine-type recombinase/integrase [candidate division Zixibacteria bacterium]
MAKVRKRGSGWMIDYYDPTGKRIRKTFKKKGEAEAELGKRISLKAEGRYLDVKIETKMTFDELAERYIENFKHQKSFLPMKKGIIAVLIARFSGRALSSITYYDCEKFRTDRQNMPTRSGKKRAASTLNHEINTLRHMFKKAVSWGMCERSPFERGESLHLKEPPGRLRFLSEEEIAALLSECPAHLKDIVGVDLLTGMRRGEILALRWSQIAGRFIYLQETKTNEARQIPIAKDLEAILKRIKQRQWAKGIKSEYVFCDAQGRRFEGIKRSFGSACKRAGIVDFRFHDLRHSFASHYLMRGGSLKGLQNRLGHKDLRMTMRYSHLSQEFARKEIQVMNGLLEPTGHKMGTKEKKELPHVGQSLE